MLQNRNVLGSVKFGILAQNIEFFKLHFLMNYGIGNNF